jgi:hypothetical protein
MMIIRGIVFVGNALTFVVKSRVIALWCGWVRGLVVNFTHIIYPKKIILKKVGE